ncbi:MAG: 6-phosphogluconate dehydrogenase [Deltaproteobacteria bacterium]|nr:MAG: 6-phosphogluconate dehydrogenase [Deltaproteobacteria bacterium]
MGDHRSTNIGFIGLGLMGSAMAARLQDLEYQLTVIAHNNRAPIDAAVARGAIEVQSYGALAATADIIMLCVDNSTTVETVMRGDQGILSSIRAGTLVIDFGTSLPGSTLALAQACKDKNCAMMDAPLGRTPAHAKDGLLNIMAAGDPADFTRAKPVLDDLGENVFHVGPIGAGHTLKLINNFMSMTFTCAMSEAFAMADLAGLKRSMLYEVLAAGPNHSGMMDFIKAGAVDKDRDKLAFSIANGLKDVRYYGKMADAFAVQSFLGSAIKNALGSADSAGWGDRYVTELVDYIAATYSKEDRP